MAKSPSEQPGSRPPAATGGPRPADPAPARRRDRARDPRPATAAAGVVEAGRARGRQVRELEGEAAIARAAEALWAGGGRGSGSTSCGADAGAEGERRRRSSSCTRCWPRTSPSATSGPSSSRSASMLHLVLFSLGFDDGRDLRARARLRAGRALPAEQPQRLVGSARDPAPARRRRPTSWRGPGLPAVGPRRRRRSTTTSRSSISSETRSTTSRTRSSSRADRALLERLFDLKRQLIQIRRVTSPEREMFNVLSNREDSVHLARRPALLPRRLRPPDPPDRRAATPTASSPRRRSRRTSRRSTTTCR